MIDFESNQGGLVRCLRVCGPVDSRLREFRSRTDSIACCMAAGSVPILPIRSQGKTSRMEPHHASTPPDIRATGRGLPFRPQADSFSFRFEGMFARSCSATVPKNGTDRTDQADFDFLRRFPRIFAR